MKTVWVAVAMASYMNTTAVETVVAAAAAVPPTTRRRRVVDAHVHVWGDGAPPYPYVMPAPPAELVAAGSPAQLISLMDASHVDHAVVIQPIQYLYDHQYLLNVMQANPECKRRFKYMALFDPTLDDAAFGECLLDGLARQGFVGVRFNPALFPNERMADKDGKGAAWMRKCGALNLVVGIMCFKGLSRHYDDVVALLEAGPDTNVIIDHMGFFVQNGQVDETSFAQLLSLARFQNVHVKISGLFRVSTESFPHKDLDGRMMQVVDAFGSRRLLFGTDFPFVQQRPEGYDAYVNNALSSWDKASAALTPSQLDDICFRTAERLFGTF